MADPITWLAIAGAVTGTVGAIRSGNQAAAAANTEANINNYQAQLADIQTAQNYKAAGVQEDAQRAKARQFIGNQIASTNEAGGGLNVDLLRQSIYGMESDTNAIRYDASLKSAGLQDTATMQRTSASFNKSKASSAVTAGYLNAAGSLLNSGSSYMKNKPKNNSTELYFDP